PDESRAARYVLKDYVSGKLLFCHPPPNLNIDPREYNKDLYDLDHLPEKRRKAIMSELTPSANDAESDIGKTEAAMPQGARSRHLDNRFFQSNGLGNAGHLTMPFNHPYSEQGAAARQKQLSGRKQRMLIALEQGIDPSEVQAPGKKHFKGGKKMKAKERRKLNTQDDDM
ncbi:hypothetical protein KEM55_000993, partial [Ascosphaera atra]